MKTQNIIQPLINHLQPLVVVACAVLGLAAQPALATTLTYNFEGPTYTTGYNNLNGQDGWSIQFGADGSVQPYAGGSIPWVPLSIGSQQLYSPPVANPYGGSQYLGKSVELGGGSGGGRNLHAAALTGTVTVRCDFLAGPEIDYRNYQGEVASRGAGSANIWVGIFTSSASTYVDHPSPPARQGNWAYNVVAFQANGSQINDTGTTYHRLNWVEGFDDLPRETWWRIGYTFDTVTRKITQYTSKNLITGQSWTLNNPQYSGADLYIRGGSAGVDVVDVVELYNVGNGQVHLFDNLTVSDEVLPAEIDTTLPLWASGWPKADTATSSGFTARAELNEPGTAYYVVLADGATAPTDSAAVKNGTVPGTLKSGSMPLGVVTSGGARVWATSAEGTADVTGLSPVTPYDVWFVGEDLASNLQAAPVKVDVTTLSLSGGYATWAGANSISLIPSDDSNNDGVANGVAYFMNKAGLATNPGINSSTKQVTWPNGGNIPNSEYGPGKQFVVQTSSDLQTWTDVPVTEVIFTDYSAGPPPSDGSVSYTLTGASPRFVRLKVTPN